MHSYHHHLSDAFTHACHSYRLHPVQVLQAFIGVLSVETTLFAGSGLRYWAARVVSHFTRSTEPVSPPAAIRGLLEEVGDVELVALAPRLLGEGAGRREHGIGGAKAPARQLVPPGEVARQRLVALHRRPPGG